ncbi:poly(A)-specific ribonuclease [Aureococcus anophagefferens]|nr:poly(A)-specific ribonuclease [Aureococcus anophagefferens]
MEALRGVVARAGAASYFTRAAEEQAKPASFAAKLAIERDRQSSPSRRDRPKSVIDTAQLFSRPGERKISLRFLCSYLLDHVIQGDNHDSVEARAALRLYRLYQKLKAEGTLRETLGRVYDHGRKTGGPSSRPRPSSARRRGVRRGRRRRAPPDVAGLTVSAPPDEPQPPGTAAPPS